MQGSGFDSTPVTQAIVVGTVVASVLVSLAEAKDYVYLQLSPHLWPWQEYWRLLTSQICYVNSTEVLFAAWTLYNLRVIERLWGSRKFLSFALITAPYTLVIPPLLSFLLRPITFGRTNYIAAGPTPLLFAILAQYYTIVPSVYQYIIGETSPNSSASAFPFTFTSKSSSYFLPLQLALSQFPASIIPALVGWTVGLAYRYELMPGTQWRVPKWIFHQNPPKVPRQEGLRERLERELAEAMSTGASTQAHDSTRRR